MFIRLRTQVFKAALKSDVHVFNYGIIKSLPGHSHAEDMEEEEASDIKLSLRIKIRKEPYQVVG